MDKFWYIVALIALGGAWHFATGGVWAPIIVLGGVFLWSAQNLDERGFASSLAIVATVIAVILGGIAIKRNWPLVTLPPTSIEVDGVTYDFVAFENEYKAFATINMPDKWAEYIRTKTELSKTSAWLKRNANGETSYPSKEAAMAALKKGLEMMQQDDKFKSDCRNAIVAIQNGREARRLAKMEEERQEQKRRELEASEQSRTEKIKNFALSEAPQMWHTYMSLGEAVESQTARLDDLRKTLVSFGESPDNDDDYKNIATVRDEMARSRDSLYEKIKQAYIQYRKFVATPANDELKDLHRKSIEDGVREAEARMMRYRDMMKEK